MALPEIDKINKLNIKTWQREWQNMKFQMKSTEADGPKELNKWNLIQPIQTLVIFRQIIPDNLRNSSLIQNLKRSGVKKFQAVEGELEEWEVRPGPKCTRVCSLQVVLPEEETSGMGKKSKWALK